MSNYYMNTILSEASPTEKDLELEKSLLECLKTFDFFESDEESAKREIVLARIDSIVKDFVKKVTLDKGYSEFVANEAGGKIFTLGSYRLGVHQKGADIDTLVLAPKHVTREDFFSVLYDMLLQRSEVTDLTKVTEAHTPIMKMAFSGIEIDLLFATLALASIPEDINLSDINILRNLDEKSVRSLNGPRVADELLRLVPNVQVYRNALCAIKLWAQRRGIYSNVMGYLGGVAWALMTARICQFYPNACSSTIVIKFFRVYQGWSWPTPVTLKPVEDGGLNFRSWNPKASARKELMPIITPAYPSMNSSYNVSLSTFNLMKEEITRGSTVSLDIELGKLKWDDLFEESDFFKKFKHYIQLLVISNKLETHSSWKGFVESRIRSLIQFLEKTPNVVSAPPYPDAFYEVVTEGEQTKYQSSFFFGLVIADKSTVPLNSDKRSINLTDAVDEFIASIKDQKPEGVETEIRHVKKKDLPSFVVGEKKKKKSKEKKKGSNKSQNGSNASLLMAPSDDNISQGKRSSTPIVESEPKKTKVSDDESQNEIKSTESVKIVSAPSVDAFEKSPSPVPQKKEVDEIDSVSSVNLQRVEQKKADIKLKLTEA